MHSKVLFFFGIIACILQSASGWTHFLRVDKGVKVEKNVAARSKNVRRLGWLSDMLAKAAKEAKEKKTSRPTKKPTKRPTPKPTVVDTPSPVQTPTTKSPINDLDKTPSKLPTNIPTSLPTTSPSTNFQTLKPTVTSKSPTKFPTKSPTSLPTTSGNICLTDPPDKYRTCFQRVVDPSNELTKDYILRDKYNIGASMYERGMNISSPSTGTYLAPYTKPYYNMSHEELTNGTVYLSLVTDGVNNLTCDDQIELEEVTLKWVKASLERKCIYSNNLIGNILSIFYFFPLIGQCWCTWNIQPRLRVQ